MGYKNNNKIIFLSKKKKSNLEIHKGCPKSLTVPIDIDLMAKDYFSYIETARLLSCVFGEDSIGFNRGLSLKANVNHIIMCRENLISYFKNHKSKINPILLLESYYLESPAITAVNINLDDFIKDDISVLKREDLGFLFFKICHENFLTESSAYEMLHTPFIDETVMRNGLLNNKISLHHKYNEKRRINIIDSILN